MDGFFTWFLKMLKLPYLKKPEDVGIIFLTEPKAHPSNNRGIVA